jgi:hypothetical protein
MTRRTGDDSSNVVPLRRGHRRPAGASTPDLDRAMRAFDRLEQQADRLQAGPFAAASESEWPIVSYQVQLPAVQRQLDKLGCFTIMNWPDTRWVLRLHAARSAAAECLDAVIRSLYRNPLVPGHWTTASPAMSSGSRTRWEQCADYWRSSARASLERREVGGQADAGNPNPAGPHDAQAPAPPPTPDEFLAYITAIDTTLKALEEAEQTAVR